jgi:hypothetical protein
MFENCLAAVPISLSRGGGKKRLVVVLQRRRKGADSIKPYMHV